MLINNLYLAIKRKFPATESEGENSVTGILKMNLLKRSQTLQNNTITRTDNTTVPAIVSEYRNIFLRLKNHCQSLGGFKTS